MAPVPVDGTPPEPSPATAPAEVPPDEGVRISVRGVTREFTKRRTTVHALGPIDLDIREGEFVSIVGPSGCGKSTLLRVVAGLIPPSQGEVVVAHRDVTRNLMAMVPQDNSVFPWKKVAANVRLGLDVAKRLPKAERDQRVAHWLDRLGLTPFADAYPSTLSGGMKQRVAIARALAVEPEVLLMDEPFAALDAQLRTLLQEELLALWQQDRRTVLFITHSIEEAILLSDRVLVCSARPGRLTRSFDVPFDRPRDAEIRATGEFAELHEEIWEVLRGEVEAQLAAASAGNPGAGR
ncbi:MAG TPA: ABC transporter ATP-binding protein [Iamia sp.]|nr:ABC transporter ATP-binding protein [Iamia sp.]